MWVVVVLFSVLCSLQGSVASCSPACQNGSCVLESTCAPTYDQEYAMSAGNRSFIEEKSFIALDTAGAQVLVLSQSSPHLSPPPGASLRLHMKSIDMQTGTEVGAFLFEAAGDLTLFGLSSYTSPTNETTLYAYGATDATNFIQGAHIGFTDAFILVINTSGGVVGSWRESKASATLYGRGGAYNPVSNEMAIVGEAYGTVYGSGVGNCFVALVDMSTMTRRIGIQFGGNDAALAAVWDATGEHVFVAGYTIEHLYTQENPSSTDARDYFVLKLRGTDLSTAASFQGGTLGNEEIRSLLYVPSLDTVYAAGASYGNLTGPVAANVTRQPFLLRLTANLTQTLLVSYPHAGDAENFGLSVDMSLNRIFMAGVFYFDSVFEAYTLHVDATTGELLQRTIVNKPYLAHGTFASDAKCDQRTHTCYVSGYTKWSNFHVRVQAECLVSTSGTCQCPEGFFGTTCADTLCSSDPCLNDATCEAHADSFSCVCPAGFDGELCETDLDRCVSSPCHATATCLSIPADGFTCECPLYRTGTLCETYHSSADTAQSLVGTGMPTTTATVLHALAGSPVNDDSLVALSAVAHSFTASPVVLHTPAEVNDLLSFVNSTLVSTNLHSASNETMQNLAEVFGALMRSSLAIVAAGVSPAPLMESMAHQMLQLPENSSDSCAMHGRSFSTLDGALTLSGQAQSGNGFGLASLSTSTVPLTTFNAASLASASGVLSTGASCVPLVLNLMADESFFPRANINASAQIIVSPVLTATFSSLSLPNPLPLNTSVSLSLPLTTTDVPSDASLQCVAWDFATQEWSSAGCVVVARKASSVSCNCTHMTNFAVLFDVNGYTALHSAVNAPALAVVSWIGVALALFGSGSLLAVYLAVPKLRTRPIILVMICSAAIFCTELFFLVNSLVAPPSNTSGCFALGMLLHYSLLAQFTAVLCIGVGFHRLLRDAIPLTKRIVVAMALAVVGVPALIMLIYVITLAALPTTSFGSAYVNIGSVCFVESSERLIAVVFAPIATVLVINLALCIRIVLSLRRQQKQLPAHLRQSRVSVAISLAFLLGASWIFAFFVVAHSSVVWHYLFSVCNGALGLFLFVNYVLAQKARSGFLELLSSIRLRTRSATSRGTTRTGGGTGQSQRGHKTSASRSKSSESSSKDNKSSAATRTEMLRATSSSSEVQGLTVLPSSPLSSPPTTHSSFQTLAYSPETGSYGLLAASTPSPFGSPTSSHLNVFHGSQSPLNSLSPITSPMARSRINRSSNNALPVSGTRSLSTYDFETPDRAQYWVSDNDESFEEGGRGAHAMPIASATSENRRTSWFGRLVRPFGGSQSSGSLDRPVEGLSIELSALQEDEYLNSIAV